MKELIMKKYGRMLAGFLGLIALQLACGFTLEPAGTSELPVEDQATLIAAQVETQLAAAAEGQATTQSLELALEMTLTAIAGAQTEPAPVFDSTLAVTATVQTETPTPTITLAPATLIPSTKVPPTKTPQPTATPLPTFTPTPLVQTFIVRESDFDINTFLWLYPGDHISISAGGEIWGGVALTGNNGPNGWTNTDCATKFPLPCAHPFSLLYFIDGQYHEAGASFGWVYNGGGGYLYLRINDDAPGNGSGSFSVTITITH
jgi:hypothetical protein